MLRANQISFNFKLCGQANETYDFLKQRTRTDIPLKPQHTHTHMFKNDISSQNEQVPRTILGWNAKRIYDG